MSATVTIERITGDNVSTLFPDIDTRLVLDLNEAQSKQSAREGGELEGYDEEQVKLMDERCIVVDENDQPIGSGSKKTCMFSHSY